MAWRDRGGRVAYRLALDHPGRVERLAVLDVLPTGTTWERADARLALAYWPWSLLPQPEPLPERLIQAAPEAVVDDALAAWDSPSIAFGPEGRGDSRSGRTTTRTVQAGVASNARSWRCGAASAP